MLSSYMRLNQSGATAAKHSLNERPNKSPISGLPVELLLHIFQLLWDISKPCWSRFEIRMERDHSTGSEYVKYGPCKRKGQKSVATIIHRPADEFKLTYREILGWIVVSHVCRLWREVAVQRPSFWSKIESGRLEWERIFVDRSLGSPTLSIFAHAAIDDNSPLIAESLPRMLDLTLAGRAVSSASKHFTKAAPKLASLKVHRGHGWRGEPSELQFSTAFETGLSASFHELSVSDIALSANSPLLSPHLTALELTGDIRGVSFSVDEFIPALRRMSCLQVLKLQGVLRSFSEDQSLQPLNNAAPVVKLLHLKELYLATHTVDIYNRFMLRVELNPQITHLRLAFDLTRGTDRYVKSLLPSYIISSDSQPQLVRTLHLNIISPDVFRVSVWPARHLERLSESGMLLSARIVHLGLTFLQALSVSCHLGRHCNEPFPLHTIQSLFVGTVLKWDVQLSMETRQWLPILEKMPALECITVLTGGDELYEATVIEHLTTADPFPCPMLRRLNIERRTSGFPSHDARFYGLLTSLFERGSEDMEIFVNGESLSHDAVKDRKASCEMKFSAPFTYASFITDLA